MKSWMWLVALVVVILVVFAVMAAVRPQTAEAPLASEEPLEDNLTPGGQPIQLAPSISPDASTSPAAEESPAVGATTITINDTGFSPSTIRVKAGTTVTFVNNGQALHWPASAPHPVHTDLRGFDAKKGLATGEEYSFTFTTGGTWGFHDHLNTTLKGSVVVESSVVVD